MTDNRMTDKQNDQTNEKLDKQKIDKQKMATVKITLPYFIHYIFINFENVSDKGVYNMSFISVIPKTRPEMIYV